MVCIAIGLGVGAGISKFEMNKNTVVTQPIVPVVTDDANITTSTPPVQNDTSHEPIESLETTSIAIKPKPTYSCPVSPKDELDQWLAPVGPDFDLGKDYIPNHLVILQNYVITGSPTTCLNASAAVHLQLMESTMKTLGLHLVVSSGYRTADYQEGLLAISEAKRDKTKNPYPLVALAGHSEHQLGMAVDLVAGPKYSLDDFINTPEYAWLQLHSWEYGFIQSYPIGSETITGYSTESWHYRYVGIVHAKGIHDQGITTYQYLKNLAAQQPLPNPYLSGEGAERQTSK
jgi:LAS superfamily LD-carboxypeptidase LdcB